MRKLLKITATFALALIFSVGMAFGQEVNIDQAGGSTADVQQDGGPHQVIGDWGPSALPASSNPGFNQENGSALEATQVSGSQNVSSLLEGEQINGMNQMYVQQRFGAHSAKIIQKGDGNLAKLGQFGSVDGASAFISQDGDNNTVEGIESNDLGVGPGGIGTGDTHAGNGNGDNSARQEKLNSASIYQKNNGNTLRFAQIDGTYNGLRIEQKDGSTAEILQDGSGNRVEGQTQLTFRSYSSDLYAKQVGDGNMVLGRQTTSGSSVFVDQSGVDNMLRVVQQ